MKRAKIKAIIKHKVNDISTLCKNISEAYDKEIIHHFRTSVKSLRSFLRLRKIHAGNPKIKLPGKFKKLYHIAGAIREVQLEIEKYVDSTKDLPHYIHQLYRTMELHKNEWEKYYSEKVLRKLDNTLAAFKYKKMQPYILKRFFNEHFIRIGTIADNNSPTDSQLHEVRKQAKDILYNSKTLEKKWKSVHIQIKKIQVNKIEKLTTAIGNYNDDRIALEHLNAFPITTIGQSEQRAILKIRSKEKQKLVKRKKNVLAAIKKINSNVMYGEVL